MAAASSTATASAPTYRIFVGNLPFNCGIEDLKTGFSKLHGYVDANVIRRPDSSMNRGYGYIVFSNEADAKKMLGTTDMTFWGRPLRFAEYHIREPSHEPLQIRQVRYRVFVRGIPENWKNEQLVDQFKKYGELGLCYINQNKSTGKTLSSGVVEFKTEKGYNDATVNRELVIGDVKLQLFPFRTKRARIASMFNKYIGGFNGGFSGGFGRRRISNRY